MSAPLFPQRLLFHFRLPCRYYKPWRHESVPPLDPSYRLPYLAELEGQPAWADVQAAWNEQGLLFCFRVRGKKKPPWCRPGRVPESDRVEIWIDTRAVHTVHRATRFCHRFVLLPFGTGPAGDSPAYQWLPIPRAREHPRAIPPGGVQLHSHRQADGYLLQVHLAAQALTGFDPQEHPQIGFNYAIFDREHGLVTLGAGPPMPYQEDPSLWVTLELVS